MGEVTVIPGTPRQPCSVCGAKARPEEMTDGRCWRCKDVTQIEGGPWTLATLEQRFPHIAWREPVTVATLDDRDNKHYACRVCIANEGLKGTAIPTLPTDIEVIRTHLREAHGA